MPNPQSSFSLPISRKMSDPGYIGLPVQLRMTIADKARGSHDSEWCLKVARLDFLGGIPPKFERQLRRRE